MHALAALQAEIVDMMLVRDYQLDKLGCISELFDACRNTNYPRARRLLDIIIPVYRDIASATEDGMEAAALPATPTLLMEAVRSQHVDLVKLLVENGACLYPCCMDRCLSADDGSLPPSPTFSARESAWSMAGDNEDLRAGLRWCLPAELINVARRNDSEALANLRAEEVYGLSPDPEDFKLSDEEGFGALDYAIINENEDMEEWLTSHGARYQSARCRNTALFEPVKSGDAAKTARRLSAGAEIKAVDAAGYTALDWSVLASIMNGQVWFCVEHAMEAVHVQQAQDFNNNRPSCLYTGLKGKGSESHHGSLMSTSAGGSSRAHFDLRDEVIEFGSGPNESLRSIGEGSPGGSVVGSLSGSFLGSIPKRAHLSVSGAMSVSGRSQGSLGTSIATSARSVGGHMRRKRQDPKPDPRGVHVAVEEELVKAGARFGQRVRTAKYILWEPLLRRDLETVRRRILAGADCTLLNDKGTALTHFALDMASPGVASALVQNGASPDLRDHRGRTVLWRAIELKQPELAEVCVEHGANLLLGLGEHNEGSLAHLAIETKQPQLAIKLLSAPGGCSPNIVAGRDRSLIWRAVELRQLDVVRECLKHDADLNRTDDFTGNTILHVALEVEPQLVPDLVKAGAPADVQNKALKTPLQIAARNGQKEAVEELLEVGVRPGRFGGSAAQEAIEANQLELALLLVERAGPVPPLRISRRTFGDEGDGDSDTGSQASFGGRSARSTLSYMSATGGRRARRSSAGTTEDDATWEVLKGAVMLGSRELVALFLTNALVGARIVGEYAQSLAQDLTEWIFEKDHKEDRVKRAESIQELPFTMYEEGNEIAASDYMHSKCGLSDALIEKIAQAELDISGMRRGSFRGAKSVPATTSAAARRKSYHSGAGESSPSASAHHGPLALLSPIVASAPGSRLPSKRKPGKFASQHSVSEGQEPAEEAAQEERVTVFMPPPLLHSLSRGNVSLSSENDDTSGPRTESTDLPIDKAHTHG